MELIDKSALVAEIEKRIKECDKLANAASDNNLSNSLQANELLIRQYTSLLSIIDTLDVKDVDLEKESELIANEIMIEVQANKYHTNIYNTERNDFNHSHLCLAARKGIELGLKAQKGK